MYVASVSFGSSDCPRVVFAVLQSLVTQTEQALADQSGATSLRVTTDLESKLSAKNCPYAQSFVDKNGSTQPYPPWVHGKNTEQSFYLYDITTATPAPQQVEGACLADPAASH